MNNATDTRNDDTHQEDPGHDGPKSQQQLEREVEQARARLGRTANELSDRLSPGELFEQALGMIREHGGEFGRNLGSQVKNNPMPMVLSSLGISWMMMSSGKAGATHSTQEEHTTAGDRAQDAGANMKESAQSARDSLERFYREQPLIAGSLGIAIGAALGALVPETEMEDDVLGEASDRSVEAAKSTAAKEYDELRDSVRPN